MVRGLSNGEIAAQLMISTNTVRHHVHNILATLAVTNRGQASTADLIALAREVRDGVEQKFGVRLVNEPVLVGCSLD